MPKLGILCPKRTRKREKSYSNFNKRAGKSRQRIKERNREQDPLPSPKERLALKKQEKRELKTLKVKIHVQSVREIWEEEAILKEENIIPILPLPQAPVVTAPIFKIKDAVSKKVMPLSLPVQETTIIPPPPQKRFLKTIVLKMLSWFSRRHPQQETA